MPATSTRYSPVFKLVKRLHRMLFFASLALCITFSCLGCVGLSAAIRAKHIYVGGLQICLGTCSESGQPEIRITDADFPLSQDIIDRLDWFAPRGRSFGIQYRHFREDPQWPFRVARIACWTPALVSFVLLLMSCTSTIRFSLRSMVLLFLAGNVFAGLWVLTDGVGQDSVLRYVNHEYASRGSYREDGPFVGVCGTWDGVPRHYVEYVASPFPGIVAFELQAVSHMRQSPEEPIGTVAGESMEDADIGVTESVDDAALLKEFEELEGDFLASIEASACTRSVINERKHAIWLFGLIYVVP